jgi:hypothetical protein
VQRLTEFGRGFTQQSRRVARRFSPYLRGGAWLGIFAWIAEKFWAARLRAQPRTARFLRWMLVPKNDTPLDVLKHYVSLAHRADGRGAPARAGKQIAYPPLVITVAKLPEPLEKEYWLNPSSRAP